MKDPRDIIIAPVVSEKSYAAMEVGVYTFKVAKGASKPEIRQAVESIWGVEVLKVNTINRKGKVLESADVSKAKAKAAADSKAAIEKAEADAKAKAAADSKAKGGKP
jgi:large subunit ribosomal protein L23